MCRPRRELSNKYLLAKIGVDTAENEPFEVWGENSIQYSFVSLIAAATARKVAYCERHLQIKYIQTQEVPLFEKMFPNPRGQRNHRSRRGECRHHPENSVDDISAARSLNLFFLSHSTRFLGSHSSAARKEKRS